MALLFRREQKAVICTYPQLYKMNEVLDKVDGRKEAGKASNNICCTPLYTTTCILYPE